MPGSRIGMLVPSSNTRLEPTIAQMLTGLGERVTVHYSRVPVTTVGLSAEQAAQFDAGPMISAAGLLADAKVDVIVWAGTAGSWMGLQHDEQLCAQIQQSTGRPATTSTLAVLRACRVFGVSRLALAVPYRPEVATAIVGTFQRHGIRCSAHHLGISDNHAIGLVDAPAIDRLARGAVDPQSQAAAILCTNLAGACRVPCLEAEFGVPVFDSVAATLWAALDVLGLRLAVRGWGALLEATHQS